MAAEILPSVEDNDRASGRAGGCAIFWNRLPRMDWVACMAEAVTSFEQLLAPIPQEQFFSEYYHRRWLHVSGPQDKFASVMSWANLNQILNSAVWSQHSLQLMLDRQRVPPGAYCQSTVDRNRAQVLQPVPDRVLDFLRKGASLLLNEIDAVDANVMAVAKAIEIGVGAKCCANLYCSWKERQAFDSHYDRHDVYAIQIVGEKRWRIYRGRANNPIEHAAFHNVLQAEYDRMKGSVAEEVTMTPGDLLYLPRGQYHDALANSEASIHVSFSCTEPLGLDWLTGLWQSAVSDPLFRADLPRPDGPEGEAALVRHVEALMERLREMALGPQGIEQVKTARTKFAIKRGDFQLPALAPKPTPVDRN